MKHRRGGEIRSIYTIFLLFFYYFLNNALGRRVELIEVVLMEILLVGYYLTDILNFRINRYRLDDLIYSLGVNSIVFGGIFIRDKNSRIFIMFVVFTMMQNIVRKFLIETTSKAEKVLILGEGEKRKRIEKKLAEELFNYSRYIVEGRDFFGSFCEVEDIVRREGINRVVVIDSSETEKKLEQILALKLDGIKVVDYLAFMEDVGGRIDHMSIDVNWIIKNKEFCIVSSNLHRRSKRLFDILLSIILGIIVLPIIGISALIVKLESPGPIFFRQKRVGEGAREFEIIKFRSMREHDPDEYPKYAGKKDNRITWFGSIMRRTRIDELPQLWMILKGDMSFVGPRPEWDILCNKYKEEIGGVYNLRHMIKPGVTGWAQVMYPYGVRVEDARNKLEYDLYYIKNQNFILDMLILFKTVKIVVFGRGM